MGKLDNKVAIITGASQGMGASHAKLFIKEGAKVVITDVKEDKGTELAKELGDNAMFVKQMLQVKTTGRMSLIKPLRSLENWIFWLTMPELHLLNQSLT